MSILTLSMINAASSIRIHHTQHKAAPLTLMQKKEKAAPREENQAGIDAAVDEWFSSTVAKENELAARFNKKPRYFLSWQCSHGLPSREGQPPQRFHELEGSRTLRWYILYHILNNLQLIQLQKGTKRLSSIFNASTMRNTVPSVKRNVKNL
jgi:hypothetical protein